MSVMCGEIIMSETPLDFFVMKNYCDWKIISPHMTLITPPRFFFFVIEKCNNSKL